MCTSPNELWLFLYCQQLLNKICVTVTSAWLGLIFGCNSPRQPPTQSFRTQCWQQLWIFNISFHLILGVTIPINLKGKGGWGNELWLDLQMACFPSIHIHFARAQGHITCPEKEERGLVCDCWSRVHIPINSILPLPDSCKVFSNSFNVVASISSWSSLQIHCFVFGKREGEKPVPECESRVRELVSFGCRKNYPLDITADDFFSCCCAV